MADILTIFFGIAAIIALGFLAEYLFIRIHIPDVLLLLLIGMGIGPVGFGWVTPDKISPFVAIFTTFALIFLLFEGASNLDLRDFIKGIGRSLLLTIGNFLISVIFISGTSILLLHWGFGPALMLGTILGGISSAFVIPVVKYLKMSKEAHAILATESALSDVFCIVFTLAIVDISLKLLDSAAAISISPMLVLQSIFSLFALALFFSLIAGGIWIFLIYRMYRHHTSYLMTIAYILLLYVITERFGGNGAIACLFFGIIVYNAKYFISMMTTEQFEIVSKTERLFYSQLSFFLKTFFFVYIGILISFSQWEYIVIGLVLSFGIMMVRNASDWFIDTRQIKKWDRAFIRAVSARGLAAAILAAIAGQFGLPYAEEIQKIVIMVILFTIVLSSIRILMILHKHDEDQGEATKAQDTEKQQQSASQSASASPKPMPEKEEEPQKKPSPG